MLPEGYKHSAETKVKISKSQKGRIFSAKHLENLCKAQKKRFENPEERRKMSKATKKGMENPAVRKRLVESAKNRVGEKSGAWKGGISFEYRPSELTDELKQAVRKRDNFTCQFCYRKKPKQKKLDTHHIDYDRENNHPDNLITICRSCHIETQTDKEAWIGICTNLVKKSKKLNPKGHRAAVKIYKENIKRRIVK